LIATLPANNSQYTITVHGKGAANGIGVVEVYDLDQSADSQLANISTRAVAGTEADAMIGGLIAGAATAKPARVMFRAIGPSIPLSGVLADPVLDLYNSNGDKIATNDNWKVDDSGQSQEAAIRATGLAPGNDSESALLTTILPTGYTAIVHGNGGSTGIAVVEAYNLQ
jgi:hypothetical protein